VAQSAKTLMLATLISLSGCGDNLDQEARELVNDFYQTHQAMHPNGALSLQQLITMRHFLSVPLFDLLKDVSVAEEARLARNGIGSPALVNDDLFTTNPKGASSFRLLTCQVIENNANCSTEVIYRDTQQPTPYKSIDRMVLTRDTRGWVINNIVYGSAANSGMHEGDLQTQLQTILSVNPRKAISASQPSENDAPVK